MKNQQTKILKQQYQVQKSVVRLIQEINDLKQTLKFTKIKEYEIELSLNV